jgi:hypothetical protein
MNSLGGVKERVAREGFVFLPGSATRTLLERGRPGALSDWERFAASWDDLKRDEFMADGGRDRLRRHAVFSVPADGLEARLEPRQPHYQSREYNALNGGIERWYEPVEPGIASGPTLNAILAFGAEFFRSLRPGAAWRVEVHQFRIMAVAGTAGRPTPEGVHRDGVDFALVALIRRENVESGTTRVSAPDGKELGSFTLTQPLDAAIVDDARVMHAVTPVTPVNPALPGRRDVLVATYCAIEPRTRKTD